MNISWDAVAQGTTTGIVGAAVFWALGWLRDCVRNFWLRKQIRRELRNVSCGHGLQGVTTSISNRLQRTLRVRDVTLVTSRASFGFNATGEVRSCHPPERKLAKDVIRRLRSGEAVSHETYISSRTWLKKPEHAGFVEVTPFTSQGFVLPLELIESIEGKLLHLSITVEYETWTKRTRLVTVCTEGWAVDHMRRIIEHVRSELANGNLNQARKMFGLNPVSPKVRQPPFPEREISKEGT